MSLFIRIMTGFFFVLAPCQAEDLHIAVASNFSATMKQLVKKYQTGSDHKILISIGSTGKHYAQIRHGAPFDLFFAADRKRPKLLESSGIGIQGSRFTYAFGRLVLWSIDKSRVDNEGLILQQDNYHHLSIANPKLAPYGIAALDVLNHLKIRQKVNPKLIYGDNINQVYHYVVSGNADLGFIAYAQLLNKATHKYGRGSYWLVPESMHRPIEQQAIQLRKNQLATSFMDFVKSKTGKNIIREFGYDLN